MNETIEQELRELFAQDAASYDTVAAVTRLRARASRSNSRHRVLWPAVGLGSSALTALVVALVVALSSSAPAAYAFWAAVPKRATHSVVETARNTCAHGLMGSALAALDERAYSGQPVLTETRGTATALLEVSDGKVYSCLMIGNPHDRKAPFHVSVARHGRVLAAPGADQISAPYLNLGSAGWGWLGGPKWQLKSVTQRQIYDFIANRVVGGGYGPYALGQTGPGVTAIRFTFANRQTVSATVEHGWYFAWWPWTSPATSVTVKSSSGSRTSAVMTPHVIYSFVRPACQPNTAGCVFANTTRIPASGAPRPSPRPH